MVITTELHDSFLFVIVPLNLNFKFDIMLLAMIDGSTHQIINRVSA